jgi:hypothetical protein
LAGHVFEDVNGNALQDGEPNFQGVTLTVVDSQSITYTVATDAAGNFSLFVFAGPVIVSIQTPAKSMQTRAKADSNQSQTSYLQQLQPRAVRRQRF